MQNERPAVDAAIVAAEMAALPQHRAAQTAGAIAMYIEGGAYGFTYAGVGCVPDEPPGHLLAWALQNRMTIEGMLDMHRYHPVREDGLRMVLHDVKTKLCIIRYHVRELALASV